MTLRVDSNGRASFSRLVGNSVVGAVGPFRVLDGNRISIGLGADAVVVNVTVPPHVEGSTTKMELDGVELVRSN